MAIQENVTPETMKILEEPEPPVSLGAEHTLSGLVFKEGRVRLMRDSYGFIETEEGDYFFHFSGVISKQKLQPDDTVSFAIDPRFRNPKNPKFLPPALLVNLKPAWCIKNHRYEHYDNDKERHYRNTKRYDGRERRREEERRDRDREEERRARREREHRYDYERGRRYYYGHDRYYDYDSSYSPSPPRHRSHRRSHRSHRR